MRDRKAPPPPPGPADAGPREAPPAPRAEAMGAKAGYAWIPGRWDWKAGKWEWQAGHWERARAGKRWREGRWERKGDVYVYATGAWEDGAAEPAPPPPPPAYAGPRAAPPPLRDEKPEVKAGYVWARGRWDWKDGKWEWMAGHWERERAGKRWRDARWEQRDDTYVLVQGDWEDAGASPPIVPPDRRGPPDHDRDRKPPRREWKLERPVVSSYWPPRGKAGTRVVIRGKNLPTDATVLWAGAPIRAARVLAEQIVFEVPAGATTGEIAVKAGRGRPLAVGTFEVVDGYDPVAAAKKLEEERRKAAEAAWRERQKQLAKDRAAREAAARQRRAEREASREQRRAERAAALRARWDRAFLADEETQDELTLHAQRVAELGRMQEIAELSGNGKLAVRIEIAQKREDDRHDQRMAALKAAFSTKGGAR